MKYKIIASLVFTSLLSCMINAQVAGLKLREVAKKFYETYESPGYIRGRWVDFEKRRQDWYVRPLVDVEDGKWVKDAAVLFYDGTKKSFITLELNQRTSADSIDIFQLIPDIDAYNFDLQTYYGYPGWYKDVIKELESKSKLSNNELYALGRAYSSQAIGPVTNQWGDASAKEDYKLRFSTNAFSPKQLQEFSRAVDSAIAKFKKLAERNPKYQTKVGDIRDKYANEVMFKFHTLLTFSSDGLKKMILPKNLYKDSTLNTIRAILKACPQQSIYLSFGDNDFYPVLYLQQAEGFRRDIHLINYSLIGMDKFIYRATQPQFDAKGIQLTADTSFYKGTRNELIRVRDSAASVSMDQLLRVLYSQTDDDYSKYITGDHINILKKQQGDIGVLANIPLKQVRYLYKNQWVLLDMINNLKGRKICFAYNFIDELSGLNDHVVFKDGIFIYE